MDLNGTIYQLRNTMKRLKEIKEEVDNMLDSDINTLQKHISDLEYERWTMG